MIKKYSLEKVGVCDIKLFQPNFFSSIKTYLKEVIIVSVVS